MLRTRTRLLIAGADLFALDHRSTVPSYRFWDSETLKANYARCPLAQRFSYEERAESMSAELTKIDPLEEMVSPTEDRRDS